MSNISADSISMCANCGKGGEGEDNIQLKSCTACKSVKYCNKECQIAHRPQHKKECKKRVKELHDEKLFKVPPPNEDCPICFIQVPLRHTGSKYMACCGKRVCSGCIFANAKLLGDLCPFCRAPSTTSDEENNERLLKRQKVGDAMAWWVLGCHSSEGACGFPQDQDKALELWHKGCGAEAYYNIAKHFDGDNVQQNKKKARHYYELAAMRGFVFARHNLANLELLSGNLDRALKHYMISAGGGDDSSIKQIKMLFENGLATKNDYEKALRACQTYVVGIRSDQRDEAAEYDSYLYKYY